MQDEAEAPEIRETDALKRLRALITYECACKDLATRFKVSRATMGKILAGDQEMTDDMLKAIGIKRVVVLLEDKPAPGQRAKAA